MALRRINDVFDRVLVLNLDRRPERWAQARAQLERFGVRAERFRAVDGSDPSVEAEYQAYARSALAPRPASGEPVESSMDFYLGGASQAARLAFLEHTSGAKAIASKGAWGYLKSYRAILEQALADRVETLLVFDDDVVLHNDTPGLFAAAMSEIPEDWLILQLGTLQYHWEPPWHEPASPHLYRTNGCAIGSHAVGLRPGSMRFLLEQANRMDMPFDIGALSATVRAHAGRSYVLWPHLAIQRLGQPSDISTSGFQKTRSREEVLQTYRWDLTQYAHD